MRILILMSYVEDILLNTIIKGFVKIGFDVDKSLTIYPHGISLYRSDDNLYSMRITKPSCSYTPKEIAQRLEAHYFDAIIVGSVWGCEYMHSAYKYILSSAGDTPCFIVSESQLENNFERYSLPDINIKACFHPIVRTDQEYHFIPYFALEEDCVRGIKIMDTFFAGGESENRMPYLNALANAGYKYIYNHHINDKKSVYLSYLRSAKVSFGIPVFANPLLPNYFKHIEIASQGTCLFMQTPSTEYKNDHEFQDNISAIYYDNPDDMILKLGMILSNEEKLYEISKNGYEHVMNYHLEHHGAKYIIDKIQGML